MSRLKITDFLIYRYRYITSLVVMALILFALLFVTGVLVPGGTSSAEMTAATKSGNLTLGALIGSQPDNIINLPFRILQSASLHTFGVSSLSIKLPSLILAAVSIFLLYEILQLWFRRNVAIIGTLITMTSSQFLLQSQSGTSGIIYMFWGTVLLFVASKMAAVMTLRPLWLILTFAFAALSLYTPLMFYTIIPLIITVLVHPHARFIVFRQPIWAIALSITMFVVCLIPLGFAGVSQPGTIAETFLGLQLANGSIDIAKNVSELAQYMNFYNSQGGRILQPAYSMGLLLLAVVGLFRLFSAKYTAKSYIMTIWVALTLPALFLYPGASAVAILPIALLSSFAIDLLIRRWYTMFPRNPYARVAGLAPLGVLVLVLSISSMDRFIYGYQYDPDAVAAYSNDLSLLSDEINNHNGDKLALHVTDDSVPFYAMYTKLNKLSDNVSVSSSSKTDDADVSIVSGAINDTTTSTAIPSKIIVSQTSRDANRFYVYENRDS